ncbi:MAG: hypothetical protein RLZZ58_1140 [Pseudomonadota bacterium]
MAAMRLFFWLILIGIGGGGTAAIAADAPATTAPAAAAYPATPRGTVVETLFGVAVADPYRWLEDDRRSNAAVANWVTAQNAATRTYLDALPGRAAWARQLAVVQDYDRVGLPRKAGGRYFYLRGRGGAAQPKLYVRTGLDGAERPLLDPATWPPVGVAADDAAADGSAALAEWAPAPDGRHLAYAIQADGSDWRILRIVDVRTAAVLADTLRWVKFSTIGWTRDGRGFFYSRYPAPPPEEVYRAENRGHSLWYHRLGTDQAADVRVTGLPEDPAWSHHAQVTDDGRFLLVRSFAGTDDRHALTLYRLRGGDVGPPLRLVGNRDHRWQLVGNRGDRLIFLTSLGAARGRLVTIDARDPATIRELLPEGERVLDSAARVGDRIILAYLDDPDADVRLIALDGRAKGALRLGELGTASGFAGRAHDAETFFAFASFTRPASIYRYDVDTGTARLFAAPAPTFDPAAYVVQQRSYAARDGTRIPIYIVARRDVLDRGGAPTLLYGYGGFAQVQTPGFMPMRMAWVAQGGVFALASIRGGGEFGAAWHDAGRLRNKQTSFNDFIDAGEFLMADGITAPGRLAIAGRSNGGLLVGAVVNQRPDLFAAALPGVGVMDMVLFDRFTAGRYWIDDYGDPAVEGDFRNLYAYSPYHNIRSGQDYPAILVSTADTDDRVVPAHSFKYAAALQAAAIGGKPHLIRIESRAGHGAGRPADKATAEWVDQLAFVAAHTGLIAK